MKKVHILYWNSKTDETKILGVASTLNSTGEIIASSSNNLQESIRDGIFYFVINESKVMLFSGKSQQELAEFIENIIKNNI